MSETPKSRNEAIMHIATKAIEYPWRVHLILDAAEQLGMRLVPVEPTQAMIEATGLFDENTGSLIGALRDAVKASPFAPKHQTEEEDAKRAS